MSTKVFHNINENLNYRTKLAAIDADPPSICTKYEFVNALKTLNANLFQQLYAAYQSSPELQFLWNAVNQLDRNNHDFMMMTQSLSITDEMLYEIFHFIGMKRLQSGEMNHM